MDVEQEGKIVVRIRVLVIQNDALLEVLDCVLIVSNLEVSQA